MVRWLKIFWIALPAAIWFTLHALLRGSGDTTLLYAYSALPLLGFIGFMVPRLEKFCRWIVLTLLVFFAAILVIEVLMMPYKAYNLWFDLLDHGSSRGRVSQLFIKLGSLIGGFGAWYMLRKTQIDMGLIYLPGFFLFLLFPSLYTGLLALGLYLLPHIHKKAGWRLPLLALMAFTVGLTGMNGPARGIALIDNQPGTLYNRILERYPELPLVYQVPLYGQTLTERVEDGAKPILTTQNILKLNGPARTWVYLRTQLYRDFKGSGGTLIKMGQKLDRQDLEITEERPEGPIIKVTLLSDFMNIFPLTLHTSAIEAGQTSYIWDSSTASLVWSDPPLVYEEEFILYEDRKKQWLETEEDLQPYLGLPAGLSDRFYSLAEGFKRDNEQHTVDAIQEYLLHHFDYTLDTPARNDYIENFLFESQEGYCLHFATSFLIMARMNGIPCRMAEGYISFLPGPEIMQQGGTPGEALVTGYSAHTWPEVYLPAYGWRRVEVTPPYFNEENSVVGIPYGQEEMTSSSINWEQRSMANWEIPFWVLYSLLGAALLSIAIIIYRKRPLSAERTVKKLIRISSRKNWPDPEQKGWKEWLNQLENRTGRETADEWRQTLLSFRYDNRTPDQEERDKIHRLPAQLRNILSDRKRRSS